MNEKLLMEDVSACCKELVRRIYGMDILDRILQAILIF